MKGFFTKEDSKVKLKVRQGLVREAVTEGNSKSVSTDSRKSKKNTDPCEACGLYKGCKSPKMSYSGQGKKEILIIAEAPGKTEDERGIQLCGEAGQILRKFLRELNLDLDKDFWKTNSIICRPPNNRKPTRRELKLCKINLEKTIERLQPKFIWLMGGASVESFFMDRFSELGINIWRRRLIPDYNHRCFIIPMFHPAYVLRNDDEKLNIVFRDDLRWAMSCLGKELPPPINLDESQILLAQEDVLFFLKRLLQEKVSINIDYETSRLNSHCPNPRIWSIAVNGISFGLDHPQVSHDTTIIESLWKQILRDGKILKSGHNCFSGNTKYLSKSGLVSFRDSCGTQQFVWTRSGWRKAEIKSFGKTSLSKISLIPYNRSRTHIYHEILATDNHRWLVNRKFIGKDRRVKRTNLDFFVSTNELKVGDCVLSQLPVHTITKDSDAFRHGLIFADGSARSANKIRDQKGFQIRLCGKKEIYKNLFPKYTYPKSANGDPCVNYYKSDVDLKKLPSTKVSAEYVANFIEGWQLMDGTDTPRGTRVVTTIKESVAKWLMNNAALGGWFCTGCSKHYTDGKGMLKKVQSYWMVTLTKDKKVMWTVRSVKRDVADENVYCAVVPKEESFTLQYGIYTGNCKFEDAWSRARFGVAPKGWEHDTMVTQHILDHRPSSAALKFQSFVKWGVPDYESEMKKYLPDNNKEENHLDEMPLKDLLKYNAIDTLLSDKLKECQIKELERNRDLHRANDLFFDGILAFCDIEAQGICVNDKWYLSQQDELTKIIDVLETKLVTSKEGKLFKRRFDRAIKITSNKDLNDLFFSILKLRPTKTTVMGNPSVDVDALSGMDFEFAKTLLRYRKLLKIRDTYLAQFIRESIGGKIYPSFNLHTVDTYRSSCTAPNFQNIPVRDEEAKKATRSGIIPTKGNKLLEIDYSAMEVKICAIYTQDPALIEYINDPKSDMHFDQAKLVFKANDSEVSKDMRFYTKNGFVFPEIYGSYYKTCAKNLWEEAKGITTKTGVPVLEHLKSKKIFDLDDFTDHIQAVENSFWRKFPLIKEWLQENESFFKRKGYIQFLFGHRRSGFLTRNAISNYPIQGAAFHCLLWSLIRLNEIRKERGWKTKIIAQIHDSIIFDLDPREEKEVIETARKVMTSYIRKEFDFIDVALEVEAEITAINGSWYTKKEIKEE